MKITLDVEFCEPIDSKSLYLRIKEYGMNVTDLGDKTYVYTFSPISEVVANHVISICKRYGKCRILKR